MRPYHNLRVRFADCELDQQTVARLTGITAPTLSARMSGRYPFTTWEIQSIAKVLDIPPEEYHRYFFEAERRGAKP